MQWLLAAGRWRGCTGGWAHPAQTAQKNAAHLRGRHAGCERRAVQAGVVTRSMRVSGRASSSLAAFCITKLNLERANGALMPSDS